MPIFQKSIGIFDQKVALTFKNIASFVESPPSYKATSEDLKSILSGPLIFKTKSGKYRENETMSGQTKYWQDWNTRKIYRQQRQCTTKPVTLIFGQGSRCVT
jgi:hypothetical protein